MLAARQGTAFAWIRPELQKLADETGSGYLSAISRPAPQSGNKIQHRRSATSRSTRVHAPPQLEQVVIDLTTATTTSTGPRSTPALTRTPTPTKIKVTDEQFATVQIERDQFHPSSGTTP